MKVSIMIPCLNEEDNVLPTIETVMSAVRDLNLSHEVIVIDDGSTDSTSAVVEKYIIEHPRSTITLVRHERNRGLGFSYFEGAALGKGEYYIYVCGDHGEPLEALKAILGKLGQADIIIPALDQSGRSFFRSLVSRTFIGMCNLLSGKKIHYYNGSVLHKRLNVVRNKNSSSGFGYQAELLCHLLILGYSYIQVPVPKNLRVAGRSSAFRISNFLSVGGSLLRILKFRLFRK